MEDNNDPARAARGDGMTGGIAAEFHSRLSALENANAELKSRLDNAQRGGDVEPYPGFIEHVAHVTTKHFFHDKPDGFDDKYSSANKGAAG